MSDLIKQAIAITELTPLELAEDERKARQWLGIKEATADALRVCEAVDAKDYDTWKLLAALRAKLAELLGESNEQTRKVPCYSESTTS